MKGQRSSLEYFIYILVKEMHFKIIVNDFKRPKAQLKGRVDNVGKSRGDDGGSQRSILQVGSNSSASPEAMGLYVFQWYGVAQICERCETHVLKVGCFCG